MDEPYLRGEGETYDEHRRTWTNMNEHGRTWTNMDEHGRTVSEGGGGDL